MLPGKTYTPEDLLRILRRRAWQVILPFAIVSAAVAMAARQLPDQYRSDTLILVVPQRVPESYVRATVTTRIEDRLQSIQQQILSRTRLERIIQDFNLYEDERRTGIMEDIVQDMRADINMEVVKGDAFRVGYVGDNARTVMQVADRLASLFIEENLRDREVLAEGTDQFLEAQVEDARRRLIEHEKSLEDYRRRFSGELPSQLPSNLQVIQNTEMQIQALLDSQNRDRDRRLIIERQLAEVERVAGEPTAPSGAPGVDAFDVPTSGPVSQQVTQAKAALAALELRLKPEHPDIRRMQRIVRDLERKAEAEALNAPLSTNGEGVSPAEIARRARVAQLREELEQLDRQLANKLREEQRLRAAASGYQRRIEAAPTRESELIELTRDYATVQSMYGSLLAKREESKLAANLERRQIGEQFKLLDPARVAERPFSPNRPRINLLGMAAGLGLGFGLVFLLEYRDRSFKTDDEIAQLLALPVLAVVPVMQTDAEKRRALVRRVLLGCGMTGTVAACMAVVAYTFLR